MVAHGHEKEFSKTSKSGGDVRESEEEDDDDDDYDAV